MRLINADEAKEAFIGNRYGTKAIEYIIDSVPTVEAVPIKWLKEQLDKYECSTYEGIETVLELWARENEQV